MSTLSESDAASDDEQYDFFLTSDKSIFDRLLAGTTHWVGWKTIGTIYSTSLMINGTCGLWMGELPLLFANSGWLVPLVGVVILAGLSFVNCSMVAEVAGSVRNNQCFRGHTTMLDIAHQYLGEPQSRPADSERPPPLRERFDFILLTIANFGVIFLLFLAVLLSVAEATTLVDGLLLYVFGNTCLVGGSSHGVTLSCPSRDHLASYATPLSSQLSNGAVVGVMGGSTVHHSPLTAGPSAIWPSSGAPPSAPLVTLTPLGTSSLTHPSLSHTPSPSTPTLTPPSPSSPSLHSPPPPLLIPGLAPPAHASLHQASHVSLPSSRLRFFAHVRRRLSEDEVERSSPPPPPPPSPSSLSVLPSSSASPSSVAVDVHLSRGQNVSPSPHSFLSLSPPPSSKPSAVALSTASSDSPPLSPPSLPSSPPSPAPSPSIAPIPFPRRHTPHIPSPPPVADPPDPSTTAPVTDALVAVYEGWYILTIGSGVMLAYMVFTSFAANLGEVMAGQSLSLAVGLACSVHVVLIGFIHLHAVIPPLVSFEGAPWAFAHATTVLSAFVLPVVVPAWVSEKKPSVDAQYTLARSHLFLVAVATFVIVIPGSIAYGAIFVSFPDVYSLFEAVFVLPGGAPYIAVITSGVARLTPRLAWAPVCGIILRYELMTLGVGPLTASVGVTLLPILLTPCVLFLIPTALFVLEWTLLVLIVVVVYWLPAELFVRLCEERLSDRTLSRMRAELPTLLSGGSSHHALRGAAPLRGLPAAGGAGGASRSRGLLSPTLQELAALSAARGTHAQNMSLSQTRGAAHVPVTFSPNFVPFLAAPQRAARAARVLQCIGVGGSVCCSVAAIFVSR